MYKKVKMNYMRLVLPLAAVLLILALVIMLVTGFGIRYGLMTSVPIESIPAEELPGACAQIQTVQIEGTFARKGHAVEEGQEIDIMERFCMVKLEDGTYIGVHISDSENLLAVEKLAAAISEFGVDDAMKMDFGVMRGTVNAMPDELYEIFCSWADEYASGELEGKEYGELLHPLMLDVNYYARFPQGLSIALTIVAAVLVMLALALLVVSFMSSWDKSVRSEMKKVGKNELEKEFKSARDFGGKLFIGERHIWCFQKLATDIFYSADIIWVYARSRRLEGGRLSWYIVMKTRDKREYSVCLGEVETVQAAENAIKAAVSPLCTGFDKEKQNLYDKDISTFCARTKNGTI